MIRVPADLAGGQFVDVTIVGAEGPDLEACAVAGTRRCAWVGDDDRGEVRALGARRPRPIRSPVGARCWPRRCSSWSWSGSGPPGWRWWPGSAWPARRPRRLGGPPAGGHHLGAFLDPLADKVLVLGALGALAATGLVVVGAGAAHRGAGGGHQRLPVGGGPPGDLGAGPAAGQVQDRAQDLAVGLLLLPATRAAPPVGSAETCCGSPWPWPLVSGGAVPARQPPAGGPDPLPAGLAECAAKSSPSAPSCCSARSSTPTRRGSASSWPWPGIDSHFQVKVGDNHARIVDRHPRGPGPQRRGHLLRRPRAHPGRHHPGGHRRGDGRRPRPPRRRWSRPDRRSMFAARGRTMADNNLRQADVPDGATAIPQVRGTAPGLICPAGRPGHLRRARACPTRCGR